MAFEIAIPSLLDDFDLEAEMVLIKARVPVVTNNLWTDTSDTDPGIALMRILMEKIQEWIYISSARYAPNQLLIRLGEILGVAALGPTAAVGEIKLTVAPNTTVQVGFLVSDIESGNQYAVTTAVTSVVGGDILVQVQAVLDGSSGNIPLAGRVTRVISAPSAGTVTRSTNLTALTGGTDGETLEQYIARLPIELSPVILNRPEQFEARAKINPSVARAKCFRATRPGLAAGAFERKDGQMTIVLMSTAGAAPSGGVLSAVATDLKNTTWFNIGDAGGSVYLHCIGVRTRVVGWSGVLVLSEGADPVVAKTAADAKMTAYLNPLTGGLLGTGHPIGRAPKVSEGYKLLQELGSSGIAYIENLVLSNTAPFAQDEVCTAGVSTFTTRGEP
jgi:hypothetical protein